MNWKHLSLATLLGLSLTACDGKKEEPKAEEHKAGEAAPAEEHKAAETPKVEEHTEEKKAS